MKATCTHRIHSFAIALALLCTAVMYGQFTIPPKPDFKTQRDTLVYDYIKLFSEQEYQLLNEKLNRYEDSTSTQIVVAIIGTSNGDDLAMVGAKWGQQWGIGQADEDNGILILLARDDRKIDINTGYGIEYRVTDRMAEQIINRIMIPQFKSNNYYQGLDEGADALFAALNGEFKEDRNFKKGNDGSVFIVLAFIFLLIILFLRNRRGDNGRNGGNRGGGSLLDVIILSNMGRTGGFGGSGGGSFGGGGFGGGFGGGGFGGGGASGGW